MSLEIDCDLSVSFGTRTIGITSSGARFHAEIGEVAVGPHLIRFLPAGVRLTRRLSRVLARRNLSLVVTRNGKAMLELGSGVRAGRFARALGFANVGFPRGR